MGFSTVTRMAREDTRWFVAGVVMLSLVLFLVLPIGVLIAVDNQKRLSKAETRIDRKIKQIERLEDILKERNAKDSNTQSIGFHSGTGSGL